MDLKENWIKVLRILFEEGMEKEYNVMSQLFEEHFGYCPSKEVVYGTEK